MPDEQTSSKTVDITKPHGKQQIMKMDLLDMIHRAENPFDIIYHLARQLEQESSEPGYAAYVKEQLLAVYGFALQDKKLITDELHEVEARLKRIEEAQQKPEFTEEEHIRIGFAIERHKKNIDRLKLLIQRAKDDPAQLYLKKN
ncbi:MAG: hypothetical protein IJQ78_06125 [Selenomonadaceae bacterium]|nr:hypothetical protein [Selenomonadaceae bacterium]MBR0284768.1 hypothetical protein [Selenomonadaceae bacterium]